MVGVAEAEAVDGTRGKTTEPHSAEAERSVLGSILLDNECIPAVVSILDHNDYFFYAAHRAAFSAILDLESRGQPIDLLLLREALESKGKLQQAGGVEYLTRLVEVCPTAANAEYYAKIVRDRSVQRKLLECARETLAEASQEGADVDLVVDRAEQRIFEVGEKNEISDIASMREILKETFKAIDLYQGQAGRVTGISTGLIDLDDLTNGLQGSELIILAARPSMGKTSLAMNIAEHVAVHEGKGVAIFSLEVGRSQLVQNLLCSRAQVNAHRLRKGNLDKESYQKLALVAGDLQEAPLYINDEAGCNLTRMRSRARRLKRRHDIQLVIIDYLQLMEGPPTGGGRESREQEISAISRGLKALARELDVPVVALSQLNRESDRREDHKPRLADLRESGALEQDADVVMLLYREEYYFGDREECRNQAEIIVAKQRHGPQGAVKVAFMKEFVRFQNLAQPWAMGVDR